MQAPTGEYLKGRDDAQAVIAVKAGTFNYALGQGGVSGGWLCGTKSCVAGETIVSSSASLLGIVWI